MADNKKIIIEGYGPIFVPSDATEEEILKIIKMLPPKPEMQRPSAEDESSLREVEPLPDYMQNQPVQAQTKEQLLEEYNANRDKERLAPAGMGLLGGAVLGATNKLFPTVDLSGGKDSANLSRNLEGIQSSKQLETSDLLRRLQSAGVDVSDLDGARLLEEATPRLESQLGAAESRATSLGSAMKPAINTPPVSSMADIADIVQHSAVGNGGTNVPAASSLARETGQHELAHLRSQSGKVASKTAEEIAKARGTSYGSVLSGSAPHMPTPSGRLLVPQELGIRMEQEAMEALQALTPQRLAAEAEVRRLQALGKDTSRLTAKIADLQKQETLAVQAIIQAQKSSPGMLSRVGVATGKFPKISGALGGVGTALSAYDLSNADTPGELALGAVNTGLGAMSMVPPTNPATAAVRGFGALGSLGMLPINEYLHRTGKVGRGSVMDKAPTTKKP